MINLFKQELYINIYNYKMVNFNDVEKLDNIYFYYGEMTSNHIKDKNFVGISSFIENEHHIKHDINFPLPIDENIVDIIVCEEKLHKIDYHEAKMVVNNAYNVLKKGGVLRLSLSDYNFKEFYDRCLKDDDGEIFFDPGAGGHYDFMKGEIIGESSLWFPTYETIKEFIQETNFKLENANFLQYYENRDTPVFNSIDYSNGYIQRTAENDKRSEDGKTPISIVVDLKK